MGAADRQQALQILGLSKGAEPGDVDRAHAELRGVWEPHLETGSEVTRAKAQAELQKLDDAHRALKERETVTGRLSGLVLGTILLGSFVAGFLGMQAYRRAHSSPMIVTKPGESRKAPPVNLKAPDVTVSSTREEPELSEEDQQAIDQAIQDLQSDSDIDGAREVLQSQGENAIPALSRALSSPYTALRTNAVIILNEIAAGSDDSPNSDEDRAKLRPYFVRANVVNKLALLKKDSNLETRQYVAYTLGNIGDPSGFNTLVSMAGDESPDVRVAVAYGLGVLENAEALPTMETLLNDRDPQVRAAAVEGLRSFDMPPEIGRAAMVALNERLSKETDPEVRARIEDVIEAILGPGAIPAPYKLNDDYYGA